MAKKPESDVETDPAIDGNPVPSPQPEATRNTDIQQAVEVFVEQHSAGKADDPARFAANYPQDMRAEILAQCREFLMFDGLLGHQEWQEPAAAPEDGRSFGDFLIQEELGRGGMGVVYLAKQKSLNRRVALKVMASGLTLSKRHVERFRREAMANAQLRHRAIVPVHSLIEVDGTFALAMDFVAGRNLADMLDDLRLANNDGEGVAVGTLGIAPEKGYVAECAMVVAEIASALAVAHHHQVVHRDLKPRNLMIDDRRQVRLLDFGLAKSLDATRESLSMSGEITGTAHYMSPEQTLAKRVEIDHRADIWSLGVILYELLTLHRPFDGKNLQQIVYEICFKEPVALQRRNAKVPRDLVTICQKALEKDPGKRYQTATEFEADLQRFLRWEPVHAKPASAWTKASKFVRRHRAESTIAALAFVAITAVTAVVWTSSAIDARNADELLQRAEVRAEALDFVMAIQLSNQALGLRNDAATRERLGRYHAENKRIDTEAAMKVAKSQQLLDHDREGALVLALSAEAQLSSAMTRSAVLDALGSGWAVRTLPTSQRVIDGAWSQTGEQLVLGGYAGSLLFFRSDSDENPIALVGHATTSPVAGVTFASNNRIVSVGIDRTMRLWQPKHGTASEEVALAGQAATLHVSRDGERALVTTYGSFGGAAAPSLAQGPFLAQVWNTANGSPIAAPVPHEAMIIAAALSPNGRIAATYCDHEARLWHTDNGKLIAICSGLEQTGRGAMPQIEFSADNTLCAIGTADGAVRLYGTELGQLLGMGRHPQTITSIAFDPNSQRMLTGSRDETARLWEIRRSDAKDRNSQVDLREVGTLKDHQGPVTRVAFDPTGQLAATADSSIHIFDVGVGHASNAPIHSYEVGRTISRISFAPDSRRILAIAGRRTMVWDFGVSRGVVTLRQPGKVPSIAFTADGARIATAGDDQRLRLWHSRDGRQAWVSKRLGDPLLALTIDPTDRTVACSDVGGRVHVLSLQDGSEKITLHAPHQKVSAVRFLGNGSELLTVGSYTQGSGAAGLLESGRITRWDLDEQTVRQSLELPLPIISADINATGTMLVTVESEQSRAQLWSLPDLQLRGEIGDHHGAIRHVQFALDGNSVLTASDDRTARIFRINGERILNLKVGKGVRCATFSPDGQFVLTCSTGSNGAAQLWRVADGSEVLHFDGHRDSLLCGVFHSNGQLAATAANDGTTCIWPTDPVAVAARLPLKTDKLAPTTNTTAKPNQPR